jgi:hypothetical protein
MPAGLFGRREIDVDDPCGESGVRCGIYFEWFVLTSRSTDSLFLNDSARELSVMGAD